MKQHLFHFAALTALATGMVFAQAPAAGTQPAPGKGPLAQRRFDHERMAQTLNLTAAQKEQAKTIFSDAKAKAQPIRQQLRENREAIHAAVKANDTAKIEDLAAQHGSLNGKVVAIRAEAMAKFYSILTPQQRIKADQMHQQMQSRMRQRMQERMQERQSESGE
jgi:Spy/CpxP family protein refolding chaperone